MEAAYHVHHLVEMYLKLLTAAIVQIVEFVAVMRWSQSLPMQLLLVVKNDFPVHPHQRVRVKVLHRSIFSRTKFFHMIRGKPIQIHHRPPQRQ